MAIASTVSGHAKAGTAHTEAVEQRREEASLTTLPKRLQARPGLMKALLIAGCLSFMAIEVSAQSRPAFTVTVPKEINVAAGTEAALPVWISPVDAIPRQAMVLIRGLPSSIALSEGRVFDSGVWSLRIADLAKLRIAAPSTASGRTEITFSMVLLEGTILAESRSSLVIAPPLIVGDTNPMHQPTASTNLKGVAVAALPQEHPPQPPQPPAPPPPTVLAPPIKSPEEVQAINNLMEKGQENMASGKINVARLFFARAAEKQWGPAALALGKTYDPDELAKLAVLGVQPNAEMARKWYKQAADLGTTEAEERLRKLK